MKSALAFGLYCVAPLAAIIAAGVYDYGAETRTYSTDITFSGNMAVVETTAGRLGLRHGDRIVGYYLAGRPRFVAFGCEGHTAPLIALDRSALPRCARIEPIA